jgi:hypothetical protein
VKNPFKSAPISCVPLLKAVLCSDCECISESRNEECGVCGGHSLVHLGRLLGSARESEAEVDVCDPVIDRELKSLIDSAVTREPRCPQ